IVSWFAIILVGGGRKMMIGLLVLSIPVVAGAIIFLQVTRGVGYVDATDSSTTWRLTVYREGLDLWAKSARNATFGVGMDSIKRYAVEWRLFDDGKIQIGHYHSTPMQLLVERGLPALLLWLWMFAAYLWALFRALRTEKFTNWVDRGIVLGAFGGVVGFLFSSLVHYNFGDAEVAMVLYLIMALGMSLMNSNSGRNVPAVTAHPE
ncbi:MAG: O-antigen ligase family protein, partial [Acidobacteriota bacterium]|nr:O-antigen ligase family protein [Acidobacteriota bacterium]